MDTSINNLFYAIGHRKAVLPLDPKRDLKKIENSLVRYENCENWSVMIVITWRILMSVYGNTRTTLISIQDQITASRSLTSLYILVIAINSPC